MNHLFSRKGIKINYLRKEKSKKDEDVRSKVLYSETELDELWDAKQMIQYINTKTN